MTEAINQFVSELMEAWNAHDIERVTEFYAQDYEETDVGQAAPQRGCDGLRRKMVYYLRAFPDLRVTLDECVVEDSRVVLFWTWSGTHRGTFMHIPPTRREVTVRGTSLLTMEEGKIRRGLRIWDVAGLLRAIGLLPEL